MILARKNISAQDVDGNDRKRTGNLRQQMRTIPGADREDSVSLLRKCIPRNYRRQRTIASPRYILEKRSKQFEMHYDFRNSRGPEVIVRHEIEMRFDLVGIIAGQVSSGIGPQTFALDLRLLEIRFLIGQIL